MTAYIRSHWRGEQSLARSYWLNTFLGNILMLAVVGIIAGYFHLDRYPSPPAILAGLLATYGAAIVVALWQWVGCWRSAGRHVRETGRRFWARTVQVVIVLGAIGSLVEFGSAYQQIRHVGEIALGLDEFSQFEISVFEDSELSFSGYIGFDAPAAMERRLSENPEIGIVHLDSGGGYLGPARQMRDVIEQHRVDTYVPGHCESACTIAYLAGEARIIAAGASLGFHQTDYPGARAREVRAEEQADRDYMAARGIDPAFIERAYAVPHAEIWYPRLRELMEAGYITHVYDGEHIYDARAYCAEGPCR